MQTAKLNFAQRAAIAKENPALRKAMERADEGIFYKSDLAMSHPNYQSWRDEAAAIRQYSLDNLDELLKTFAANATKAGAVVHWAKDEDEACNLVAKIAKDNKCKNIIKSKTMLAEEINLNKFLEKSNLEVLETDLGEYIIQLQDSRPSHIIAPAIHLTADDVDKLFTQKHGSKENKTNEELVAEARNVLRPKLLSADMGLTGANFLVASTGSVAVVTNEGNDRYCSSIADIRVTIAGIEKVIDNTKSLSKLLKILPRAATGQIASTYVSICAGVKKDTNPQAHHIVLIDNGRRKLLQSKYRAMLRCIRCGSCMNHCPVYKVAGGLSYNSVYVGPMGAVLSPNYFGKQHDELPHAATMCGACSANCPVKIPLPDLMRELREDQVNANREPLLAKVLFNVWSLAALNPWLYNLGIKLTFILIKIYADKNGIVSNFIFGKNWFAERKLKISLSKPFRFIKR